MLTAIDAVHGKNGPWISNGGYEYNAVLIAGALALVEVGPGRLSLDAARGRERSGSLWWARWARCAAGALGVRSASAVSSRRGAGARGSCAPRNPPPASTGGRGAAASKRRNRFTGIFPQRMDGPWGGAIARARRDRGQGQGMEERHMRGITRGFAVAMAAAALIAAVAASSASAEVVYNNIPGTLPGNFASIGLAATSSTEFGGEIELAGTARSKPVVTVVMSSWACETGSWTEGNCQTPKPKKGFKVPVTVRIYAAAELSEGPVAEKTSMVKMYYRPSESPTHCAAGKWYDAASKECFHGYAFPVSIKLNEAEENAEEGDRDVLLPARVGTGDLAERRDQRTVGTHPLGGRRPGGRMVRQLHLERNVLPRSQRRGHSRLARKASGCQQEEGVGINYQPVIAVNAQ